MIEEQIHEVVVSCQNAGLRVAGKDLISNIKLDIARGKITAVVGENGAGKTTLLDVLAGDLKVTSGKVFYGDVLIEQINLSKLAQRRAYLRQQQSLEFGFKVRDVVQLGRLPFVQESGVVQEVIAALALEDLLERAYTTLSGGEKQRVQIARVLAQVWQRSGAQGTEIPEEGIVCLLDEPLASLDLRHQHHLLRLLRGLADQGLAVVLVLHNLQIAAEHADHIVLLKSGALIAQGAANEVFTDGFMQQGFDMRLSDVFPVAKL